MPLEEVSKEREPKKKRQPVVIEILKASLVVQEEEKAEVAPAVGEKRLRPMKTEFDDSQEEPCKKRF